MKEINSIYDKNRRPILIGDILKIFHFTGARKKRYYMYKQVIGVHTFGEGKFYTISHLEMDDSSYYLKLDGEVHSEIEIVQSNGELGDIYFEDRIKLAST